MSDSAIIATLDAVAALALYRYDLPEDASATLVNISENATYKVTSPATGGRWALRIHRDGYHGTVEIASEIAWQVALRRDGAAMTPVPVAGRDGETIQHVGHETLPRPRHVVLSLWESGHEPDTGDEEGFALAGAVAARMHRHVRAWARPDWFRRHRWDFETTLGRTPHWGRWRDGLGMTPDVLPLFERTVDLIGRRLARYGSGPERFGLVHGDMRHANLLKDDGAVKVIDFDDCGFSWFLYDCATTVSFIEHRPEVPGHIDAWLGGYRSVGLLSREDEAEIGTFVMLRRILLIAWVGSHSQTDLARQMGASFTQDAIPLCESYLAGFGI
ncbi:phosphotransferase enzyme family protein [Ciceribacter sp. sgz301302]